MRLTQSRRGVLGLALLLGSAAMGRATLAAASLTGQVLVAAPEMADPRFRQAVILLVHHGADGAFGLIVNRPLGDWRWARLLAGIGEDGADVPGSVPVFAGGPVSPGQGFVLHSPDYHDADTVAIDGQVAMTANAAILRALAHNAGPRRSLIAFGYAGWAPGQLERELARHGWITIADDPALVFDLDRARVWDAAVARQTLTL